MSCAYCCHLTSDDFGPIHRLDKCRSRLPESKHLIAYHCTQGRFGYWAAASSILKPSPMVRAAQTDCPHWKPHTCVVCGQPGEVSIDHEGKILCAAHYIFWSNWLDAHPDRFAYFAYLRPRRQPIKSRYFEVFWEFMREIMGRASVTETLAAGESKGLVSPAGGDT